MLSGIYIVYIDSQSVDTMQATQKQDMHHGKQSQGSDSNSAKKEKVNQDGQSIDFNSAGKEKLTWTVCRSNSAEKDKMVNQDSRTSDSNSAEKEKVNQDGWLSDFNSAEKETVN